MEKISGQQHVEGQDFFGVYVHWPFCAAKCPYCDFNSHIRHHPVDQTRFANAFIQEMRALRARTGPRKVTSIFLGGGTPSLMHPSTVACMLNEISTNWSLADNIEVTLEANPSSVEAGRFRDYRTAGINRVSLGVQALNDHDLKQLGRLHNVKEAFAAIDLAGKIFPRFSFDLIYARPHQSIAAWRSELKQALTLVADHLSLYQLTLEEGTPFYNLWKMGKLVVPDEDHAAALYLETQDVTQAHGLPAYEISNHAVPGAESQHNLLYWRYGEYLGIGPGAHGRFVENGIRTVTMSERYPETWLEKTESHGHGILEEEFLTKSQEGDEFLIMGLRLCEGVDLSRYCDLSGQNINRVRLSELMDQGLIEALDNTHIRTTFKGALLLNAVVAALVT